MLALHTTSDSSLPDMDNVFFLLLKPCCWNEKKKLFSGSAEASRRQGEGMFTANAKQKDVTRPYTYKLASTSVLSLRKGSHTTRSYTSPPRFGAVSLSTLALGILYICTDLLSCLLLSHPQKSDLRDVQVSGYNLSYM